MHRALSSLCLLLPAAAVAQEFSGTVAFDGSPGVKFSRCSEKPQLAVAGKKKLGLLVRAEGRSRKLVVIPEVDGKAEKGISVHVKRSPLKSDHGKALSLEAALDLDLPDGAKSVSFRCVGADDAFLGVKPSAEVAALPELPSQPPPPLPVAAPPELPSSPPEPAAAPPELPASPPELPAVAETRPPPEVKPIPQEPTQASIEAARAAQIEKPADKPLELAMPKSPPPPPLSSDAGKRITLALRAGGQRSSEAYTDPTSLGLASGELSYAILPRVPIRLGVDWRTSKQGYLVGGLKANGQSAFNPLVDEQRTDISLSSGYDFGPLLLRSGRLQAMPTVGARYLGVRNGSFPVDLFGPEFGARLRFAVSDGLYLMGATEATFNAMKKKGTLSAVGRPFADVAIQAGVGLPLSGGQALELQYVGDVLPMTYDTRVAHGASVGVRSEF